MKFFLDYTHSNDLSTLGANKDNTGRLKANVCDCTLEKRKTLYPIEGDYIENP